MGNIITFPKDGTAQGVAKVRHYESLLPSEQQLYSDPFAYAMFPGSIIQQWLGPSLIDRIYRWMNLTGFQEMISIRTKWLDDEIMKAATSSDQLLILGAGYDTRGFRLNLWNSSDEMEDNDNGVFRVIEVDQPEVQKKKIANLQWLVSRNKKDGEMISDRIMSKKVAFIPVNFNEDNLQSKLETSDQFQSNKCTIVTMEGVTQYTPKESTADTLKKLKNIVSSGSTLLITYVDEEKCFIQHDSTTQQQQKQIEMVKSMAAKVGEKWISSWRKDEFELFLSECGYNVISDTSPEDYNETYLKRVGRQLDELLSMERFVVAKLL